MSWKTDLERGLSGAKEEAGHNTPRGFGGRRRRITCECPVPDLHEKYGHCKRCGCLSAKERERRGIHA
jgi:hypothetical protein